MHVALCCISNDSPIVLTSRYIGLDINSKSAVKFQLESVVKVSVRAFRVVIAPR